MTLEFVEYPLATASEGKHYPLVKDQRVLETLWTNMCTLQKLPISSEEFHRGLLNKFTGGL